MILKVEIGLNDTYWLLIASVQATNTLYKTIYSKVSSYQGIHFAFFLLLFSHLNKILGIICVLDPSLQPRAITRRFKYFDKLSSEIVE